MICQTVPAWKSHEGSANCARRAAEREEEEEEEEEEQVTHDTAFPSHSHPRLRITSPSFDEKEGKGKGEGEGDIEAVEVKDEAAVDEEKDASDDLVTCDLCGLGGVPLEKLSVHRSSDVCRRRRDENVHTFHDALVLE